MKKKIIDRLVKPFVVAGVCSALVSHSVADEGIALSKINSHMTVISNNGGNILVEKGNDAVLVIDNGYSNQASEILPAIQKIAGKLPIKYVLNTHWHGDHTGSNEAMGKTATIVAHDNVRNRLMHKQSIPVFNMTSEPYRKEGLPTLTYPQSMHIHFNNDSLQLLHLPNGHTDSDSIVQFKKANVIHMGDHMFYPMYPFVDIGNGGDVENYIANVKTAFAKMDDATVVVPGHGPLSKKEDVKRYITMLEGTVAEVRAMVTKGLTLQQAQKQGLSKQWKSWDVGFIKEPFWIETIYRSLKQSK